MTRGDADRNVKSATLDRKQHAASAPARAGRRTPSARQAAPGQPDSADEEEVAKLGASTWKDHLSSRALPLAGSWLKELLRGKPFGARRPASARLPRQSASSLSVRENARPAASVHDSPSSTLNALTSDSPPSL